MLLSCARTILQFPNHLTISIEEFRGISCTSTAVAVSSNTGKTPHTTHHTPPQHTTHKHTHSHNNARRGFVRKLRGFVRKLRGSVVDHESGQPTAMTAYYFYMDITKSFLPRKRRYIPFFVGFLHKSVLFFYMILSKILWLDQ